MLLITFVVTLLCDKAKIVKLMKQRKNENEDNMKQNKRRPERLVRINSSSLKFSNPLKLISSAALCK
ncbi:hypothetical protein T12_13755 [Trichinella patagoniensis]|uniref:Uncharacterized protein n=1 Tax=Trichinella patagoniensis TaxID=990121 RepID=A0A0V0ZG60_9BILA|nr:hypothetical protein T12_13755 [Trichinella patagoniensis]